MLDYFYFVPFWLNLTIFSVNCLLERKDFYGKNKFIFAVTKLNLMLILLCHSVSKYGFDIFSYYLILCWFGDFFLLFRNFFIQLLGTLSFLSAHITLNRESTIEKPENQITFILIIIPICCFFISTVPKIISSNYKFHGLMFYCTILSSTFIHVCNKSNILGMDNNAVLLEYIGRVSFLISDAILIRNEINDSVTGTVNFFVMLTYGVAQFLIILSRDLYELALTKL